MILDPIDQSIRDQGFNFVPFDRYLAEGFRPNTLDMSGSGLSSFGTQGSIPTGRFGLPVLFPGRDGTGGGTTTGPNTSGFDYETDAYDLENKSAFDKGLTEEEDEALGNLTNPGITKGMLGTLGLTALGFLNPFGAIYSLNRQKNKQQEALEEAAREAATQAAGRGFDMAGTGDTSGGRAGGGGFGGNTAGGFSESDPSATEGSHAYGGRVGYMMGGLTDLVDIYD